LVLEAALCSPQSSIKKELIHRQAVGESSQLMPTPMSWMPILALHMQLSTATPVPATSAPVNQPHPKARIDTVSAHRTRDLVIGAAIGGVIGGLAGLYVSRNVSIGCNPVVQVTPDGQTIPSQCNARRTERNIRIGVTASTATVGAGLGLWATGLLRHTRW